MRANRFIKPALPILFFFRLFAAGQDTQQPAPIVDPGAQGPAAAANAAASTKTPANTETLDTNAVPVISGLTDLSDTLTPQISSDLDGMADKNKFAIAVPDLIKTVDVASLTQLQGELAGGKSGTHLLIHVLKIDDSNYDPKNAKNIKIVKSTWYIWRAHIGFDEYSGTRLYGINRLGVLSVMGPFKEGQALANAKELQYYAVVKKKLAANVQDFLSLLSIPSYVSLAQAKIQPKYAVGFGTIDKIPSIADVTVEAGFDDPSDSTKIQRVGSKEALDNEGFHWWDASVGFPITRVEELQYDQTGNTIQTRQVDKASILGLADVYFRAVDIKDPGKSFTPALVLGVGLQGNVRDRLFAGVSTNLGPIPGLKFTSSAWYQTFRPYVGVMFLNVQRTVGNPAPGAPSIVEHEVRKLGFGINVPVASTIKRLAAGSSSNTTSSNSAQPKKSAAASATPSQPAGSQTK